MGIPDLRVVALALAAALGTGCLGAPAPAPSDGAGDAAATGPNRPPVFFVTATPSTGEVPLEVTFHVDGYDPDGDSLSWYLDATGDRASEASGKGIPTTHVFVFDRPGAFASRVTVTDGTHFPEQVVSVSAHAPRVQEHPLDPLVFEGAITGVWAGDYDHEPNLHPFDVPVVPKRITASFEVAPTAVDLDFVLRTPSGDWADGRADPNEPTGLVFPSVEPDLVVTDPDKLQQVGQWTLEVWAGASVAGEYRATIAFQ